MSAPAASGDVAHRQRDGAAARLYLEYRERIYRFCHARLRSREEAEDAVQNVFMRVHMALDRGVVPEYEAAWLYKIAHNVCLSRAESTSRRARVESLQSFDDDELPFAAPEVGRDELAGLSQALEAMPHNLRTAILLREWQGLSYAEIADAMGVSVSAVETLIFRARRHLADALEHGTGAKRKTVATRLLNLLGLGSLRGTLFGAGTAKLAAGAALLALAGSGAAVALTEAQNRPAPAQPGVPHARVAATAGGVAAVVPAIHRVTANARRRIAQRRPGAVVAPQRGSDTTGAGHQAASPPPTSRNAPAVPVAAPPASRSSSTTTTAAFSKTTTTTTTTTGPTTTVPTTTVPTTTVTVPSVSVPTVTTVPTVTVPTVTVPTVSVPTVSVPTVSVPTVSVPTVSLPAVGGGVVPGT